MKIWLVVPPLSLHAKLWLTRLLSANQRFCASQLSASTQANSIPIRWVNQCLLDNIQDGTMTLNLKKPFLERTKHALSKIWSFLIFKKLVRNVTLKAMLQLVDKRRLIASALMEFVTIVTLSLKQLVVISTAVHVKKLARHWLTAKLRERQKTEQDQMCKEYIQQKGYKIIEMWECKWWHLYRTNAFVKILLRANCPYQQPLSEERLMQEIKSPSLFSYFQCDLKNSGTSEGILCRLFLDCETYCYE